MRASSAPRLFSGMACLLALLGVLYAADRSPSAMADAATRLLAALTPEQKQQAAFAFDAGGAAVEIMRGDGRGARQRDRPDRKTLWRARVASAAGVPRAAAAGSGDRLAISLNT